MRTYVDLTASNGQVKLKPANQAHPSCELPLEWDKEELPAESQVARKSTSIGKTELQKKEVSFINFRLLDFR